TVTFDHAVDPTTITTNTFFLKDSAGNTVPSTVVYDPTTRTATLTPNGFFATSATYTATVLGGSTGAAVKDLNGRPVAANSSWSFVSSPTASFFPSLWRSTATPQMAAQNDSNSVELGVKFYSTVGGYVSGIRFYKGPGNTGTHVGNLWSSTGQLL